MRYAVVPDGKVLHKPSCYLIIDAEQVQYLDLPRARRWLAFQGRRRCCGQCKPSFMVAIS